MLISEVTKLNYYTKINLHNPLKRLIQKFMTQLPANAPKRCYRMTATIYSIDIKSGLIIFINPYEKMFRNGIEDYSRFILT